MNDFFSYVTEVYQAIIFRTTHFFRQQINIDDPSAGYNVITFTAHLIS